MIAFRATVRGARRNGLGLLLTPLVRLRRVLQALALALERMIWRELIEGEAPANPLVSLLAFLLFSGLCLLTSLQGTVGYVIGLLLFLLPMEWLMARLGYGAPVQRRVLLQSWGDRLRLFLDTPEGCERLELGRSAVTAVLIRQASVRLPPLGERSLGWDLVLAVADPVGEHLLARAAGFSSAWQRGHALAADLGVPLRLAGAPDGRQLPEARSDGAQPEDVWRLEPGASATRLVRSRRTVGAAQWCRSFVAQGSDLLFVAVLNTVMVKYGGFLVWMFGPRLGLGAPTTLVLDLSLPGLLSLGLPEWTVIQALLVVAALGAAGIGRYRQWSPQELSVADDQIHLRRPGQPSRQLPLRMITAVLRLPGPEPRVILWSERRPPIVVDGLSGEREAAELLEKLAAVLDRPRR
ncbi:hypothetical protein L107_09236 [Cyanobium sp. Copco_Reservoir_LC18]|uniref:hypothetical protein n=1 Tax=Cyanobium sp. Copco_Reservoir_LC18 TaxID=1328305 RepID=UPI0013594B21|nr:hypothetical protein [Cyanobium sp. Copco_Reservoir_LC18]KAF0653326.1 hypothetical protein L107_09236 [Cyanobium sp. Copco_Reservoir_LC18]